MRLTASMAIGHVFYRYIIFRVPSDSSFKLLDAPVSGAEYSTSDRELRILRLRSPFHLYPDVLCLYCELFIRNLN